MRFADAGGIALVLALVVTTSASAGTFAPRATVDMSTLERRVHDGRMTADDELFTGVAIEVLDTGEMVERVRYVDGLRHGSSERWYADGTPAFRATYRHGRRDGTVESWWPDGTRRAQAHYDDGVADGVQREWYRSGAPFKELTLVDGQEAGLQRAWREHGALYANYVARDGRNFGLKRAELCFEVTSDETDPPEESSTGDAP